GVLVIRVAMTGMTVWWTTRPAPPAVTRTTIVPPSTALAVDHAITRNFAISADGRRVVYVTPNHALAIRALDEFVPTTLTGLGQDPLQPIFSPDGQWLAFLDHNILKKIATMGGAPATVTSIRGNARG